LTDIFFLEVKMSLLYNADFALLGLIQNMRCNTLDVIFSFITHLGDGGMIWLVWGICLVTSKKYRKCGVALILSLLITSLFTNSIKEAVMRPRPFEFNEYVLTFIKRPNGYSFPSGHTSSSFTAASTMFFCGGKMKNVALPTAFLIAFSRLYFYVHFPSDVFVGALLGISVAFCVHLAQKRTFKKV
jgi:undecaprenyl-diphosphatase